MSDTAKLPDDIELIAASLVFVPRLNAASSNPALSIELRVAAVNAAGALIALELAARTEPMRKP